MKKAIFTLITITAVVLGSINFSYASTANITETTLSNTGAINKIEVRGNVEVIVAAGAKDQVKVAGNYYAGNAMVQGQDGVLRIASYKAEKLVVYVTANDLRSISAYDNAVVKSDGRLAFVSLDVNLYNNAYAGLKLDSYAANITVNDRAKADLTGNAIEYNLNYSNASTVNRTELVAVNTAENKMATPQPVVKHRTHLAEEIAGL